MIQGINDKNPRLVEWADVYNMILGVRAGLLPDSHFGRPQ